MKFISRSPSHRLHTLPSWVRAIGYPLLIDLIIFHQILRLLMVAFQRRLTFTVATSVTTGLQNAVVWNEIHHKTELGYNARGHGYPDPSYFDNVLAELASQGVTEDDYPDESMLKVLGSNLRWP